jgi:hypothetical protein
MIIYQAFINIYIIVSWKATLSKYSIFYIYSNWNGVIVLAALHWLYCVQNFKTTVDFVYNIFKNIN